MISVRIRARLPIKILYSLNIRCESLAGGERGDGEVANLPYSAMIIHGSVAQSGQSRGLLVPETSETETLKDKEKSSGRGFKSRQTLQIQIEGDDVLTSLSGFESHALQSIWV